MRWLLFVAACLALALAQGGGAAAQIFNPPMFFPTPATGYTGPADIVSGPAAFWSLRAYSAATRGAKAVNVCNVADAACADFSTDATTGNLTITTIGDGSDCSSVICTIKTWYDQTGNGNDLTQSTIANRATLTTSCLGSLPCADYGSGAGRYFGQTSPATGGAANPLTIFSVSVRASGTAENDIVDFLSGSSGEAIETGYEAVANQYFLFGSNGSHELFYNSAANGDWHVAVSVVNGASPASVLNVDGTEATGTVVMPTQAFGNNKLSLGSDYLGNARLNGKLVEAGIWYNFAADATQRSNLCHNGYAYWGTSKSC